MSGKKTIVHTSSNDLTHSMVHYLLTIHKLKEEHVYARVTDIAKELGLTKGSVSTAVANLRKKSLVVEDDNKFLTLSDAGHVEVHHILSSRTLMYYFLKDILKVDDVIAHQDSCLVEHLISTETRKGLFEFMRKVVNNSANLDLSTSLDLEKFANDHEFNEAQKGDRYL